MLSEFSPICSIFFSSPNPLPLLQCCWRLSVSPKPHCGPNGLWASGGGPRGLSPSSHHVAPPCFPPLLSWLHLIASPQKPSKGSSYATARGGSSLSYLMLLQLDDHKSHTGMDFTEVIEVGENASASAGINHSLIFSKSFACKLPFSFLPTVCPLSRTDKSPCKVQSLTYRDTELYTVHQISSSTL